MSVTWELGTDEIDDEAAIGVTAGGSMEEGFSIRRKGGLRRMIDVGEVEIISSVGAGITEADDRFITSTRRFWWVNSDGGGKDK